MPYWFFICKVDDKTMFDSFEHKLNHFKYFCVVCVSPLSDLSWIGIVQSGALGLTINSIEKLLQGKNTLLTKANKVAKLMVSNKNVLQQIMSINKSLGNAFGTIICTIFKE